MKNIGHYFFRALAHSLKVFFTFTFAGTLIIGCSTTRKRVPAGRIDTIHKISQDFWLGHDIPSRPSQKAPLGCFDEREKRDTETMTTSLNTLLTVFTLGIYSPLQAKMKSETHCN